MIRNYAIVTSACLLIVLAGCSFTMPQPYPLSRAKLAPEAADIWSRPQAMGLKTIGDAEGRARSTYLLGFIPVSGDISSALSATAMTRAIQSQPGGEGMFVLRVEERKKNFLLFSQTDVLVRGKVVKTQPLGEVAQGKADLVRSLLALSKKTSRAAGEEAAKPEQGRDPKLLVGAVVFLPFFPPASVVLLGAYAGKMHF